MKLEIKRLFDIEESKKLLALFWGKYDKTEIIKMTVVTAVSSIIDTIKETSDGEQEIEFEVSMENTQDGVDVTITVLSYEEKDIEMFKKDSSDYSLMILNDIDLFVDEFYTNLEAIVSLSISSVITNSEKDLTSEIHKLKSEIKSSAELVETAISNVGKTTFGQMNEKLINNEIIIGESKVKYRV